jgi:hypothetical protein
MKEDELKIKQEIKTFLPFNQRNNGRVVKKETGEHKIKVR